jgi:2-polyprenyl-3-methyl-5-hydroxy-6-metoxy-1,4-benzoquinol methylase
MNKLCIVCDGSKHRVVFQEFGVDILKCSTCGHVFSSHNASQDYDGYFGAERVESEDQFWWNEAHGRMYEDFCRRFVVGKAGKLLDVGCGLGYFVKWVSDISDWQVFGYEISKQAVDFARTKLILPNVFCGRVEDSGFADKSFDIITLWDVIEHIPDPNPLLSYLSSLLTSEGLLFIHTPNVEVQLPKAKLKRLLRGMQSKVHYLEARDHINIYSTKTITQVLGRNGYSTVRFMHLKPIQGVSGSKNRILTLLKNSWFYSSVALSYISWGRVNLDNLFVVATK